MIIYLQYYQIIQVLVLLVTLNVAIYKTYLKPPTNLGIETETRAINQNNTSIVTTLKNPNSLKTLLWLYLSSLIIYLLIYLYQAVFVGTKDRNFLEFVLLFLLVGVSIVNLNNYKDVHGNKIIVFVLFVLMMYDISSLLVFIFYKQNTFGISIQFIRLPISFFSFLLAVYQLIVLKPLAQTYENIQDNNRSKSLIEKFGLLKPYLIPKNNWKLKALVIISYLLLILGRITNLLVPVQYKKVVDSLTTSRNKNNNNPLGIDFAWKSVLLFCLLRFLQGGSGLISSLQSFVLIPINQYTTKKISLDMFQHLHNLSLDYHIKRKTGEVLRIMDRGTSSVVSLINSITFQILPIIADIIVAITYFVFYFGVKYGFVVFISMFLYTFITVKITTWRNIFRRKMNEYENKTSSCAVDSLLNFETVKYYGNEQFELNRYKDLMNTYLKHSFYNSSTLPLLNVTQNMLITIGLIAGSLLCAYDVSIGKLSVGDFVLFLTYLTQLYVPLNFFGTYYRIIQRNFVDMENMLALFEVKSDINDIANPKKLVLIEGPEIEFKNVSFRYNSNKENNSNNTYSIENLNLTIPQGKTIALVGPSGAGKSTIMKLLFRFYDVQSGEIKINNTNIKQFSQQSLRNQIGVVPQDTVLFNESIKYNIKYGKVDSSDNDVFEASKIAQIHSKIIQFDNGYETVVGERGLRLSGGEKQRVAIARTVLKSPKILILDEATSSLDMTTENQMQKEFIKIFNSKKITTIIIAHRLSTVKNADLIYCLKNGKIVESGDHNHLLSLNGVYTDMWNNQNLENNKDQ